MKKTIFKLFSLLALTVIINSCSKESIIQKPRIVKEKGISYFVQDSILIDVRDGSKIHAIVVRNPKITKPTAAILFHTIYAKKNRHKQSQKGS